MFVCWELGPSSLALLSGSPVASWYVCTRWRGLPTCHVVFRDVIVVAQQHESVRATQELQTCTFTGDN
ncbi:hypothetical protein Y032_0159g3299 [Ancylostoma ceylanicum]|uniref:Uncharacterized protein n=1 Tax=Ancylostoma ceylanicum TaxID=53326 RepID=A0A016SYK4_9BILA|nr:hypothetical protein Y032_0159g3299 [Ancylostoma ceylanicum]